MSTPRVRHLGARVDLAGLVADAVAEGRRVTVLHGGTDRASFWDAVARELALPDWFGRNLDALWDVLRSRALEDPGEWEIVWEAPAALAAVEPTLCAGVRDVLDDLAAEFAEVSITTITR